MNYKISLLLIIFLGASFVSVAYGQAVGAPQGLINTSITGVKFLDAYFGTSTVKMEVGSGDKNVPLTVVMANIGNSDVVGFGDSFLYQQISLLRAENICQYTLIAIKRLLQAAIFT